MLILTDGVKPNVYLSARNLPNVHVHAVHATRRTYHLLWSDVVLIEDRRSARGPVAEKAAAPAKKQGDRGEDGGTEEGARKAEADEEGAPKAAPTDRKPRRRRPRPRRREVTDADPAPHHRRPS